MKKNEQLKIAFYVSGSASRLLRLFYKNSCILRNTKIIINDNKPNHLLQENAEKLNISYYEFSYNELNIKRKEKSSFISQTLLTYFNDHKIDYCFCFGDKLLTGNLLEKYKNRIINFHPSILPLFPGLKSIDQALKANAFIIGNTAHFIDDSIDQGPIIMQNIIHRSQVKSYDDVLNFQINMIEQIFQWLIEDRIILDSNNNITIISADYRSTIFFPKIENN